MTLWTDIAAAAGVSLSDVQIGQLNRYLDLLIETNQTLNLTRIVDRADAEVKHVADALTLLPFLPPVAAAPAPRPDKAPAPLAKPLKVDMTGPEKILADQLRGQCADIKFRRQQPIGPYLADFYSAAHRLVIELEDQTRERTAVEEADQQAWLSAQGHRIVRFTNREVTDHCDAVVATIQQLCYAPLPAPAAPDAEKSPRRRLSLGDVGTGGGIPGVILAIARPDIAVMLIDATAKKLTAVQAMCDRMELTNVSTLHTRMEAVKRTFDVVTARGVAELGKLLDWCGPLVAPRSVMLAMKGPRVVEELANLPASARKQFTFAQHAVAAPGLNGHVIVEIRRQNAPRPPRPAGPGR